MPADGELRYTDYFKDYLLCYRNNLHQSRLNKKSPLSMCFFNGALCGGAGFMLGFLYTNSLWKSSKVTAITFLAGYAATAVFVYKGIKPGE